MSDDRYHGGDVLGFAARYGLQPETVLDFSSNINPFGPPAGALQAIRDRLGLVAPYPDRYCRGLRRALSEALDVPPEAILPSNGAAEGFYVVGHGLRPRRVLIPTPSFGGYQAASRAAGAEIDRLPLSAGDGFRLDPGRLEAALEGARAQGRPIDLVFMANPNNPTGRLIDSPSLDRILDLCRARGVLVVLDEAFLDFCSAGRGITRVSRAALPGSGLLVARSMTKFYSLAGLRLGCLVGPPELIDALELHRDPWSVNALAQAAGQAVLSEFEFAAMTRDLTVMAREELETGLRDLGLSPLPSAANFLLTDLSPIKTDAGWLQKALGPAGILIRDCSSFDGLGPAWIRLAVRRPEENARLVQEMKRVIGHSDIR